MNSALSLFTLNILSSNHMFSGVPIDQILNLLKIPPLQRQFQEVSILKALTSSVSFFKEQIESHEFIHYQSCQSMRHEFFREKETIFNYGDYGRKFYIIISGSVEVLVPEPNTDYLVRVAVLNQGKSFGETALVTENPRNATISCLTDCNLAVLNKDDFLRILGKITDKKISSFVDLLKLIPVFRAWSKKNIESLYSFFKPVEYKWKKSVFCVGDESDAVYIVKSGEFEISKVVNLPDKTKVNFKIAVLTVGELFGDEDVLKSRPREYSCACYSTTGELLEISAKDFLLKVMNEDSLLMLNSKNNAKLAIRTSKEKVFQKIFNSKKHNSELSDYKKASKSLKVRKKCLPYEKSRQDFSNYLKLSQKDIENIKQKAMGKHNRRINISLNLPMDLSYRTPSPFLGGIKLKPLHTKRSHIESNYFSIQKPIEFSKSYENY